MGINFTKQRIYLDTNIFIYLIEDYDHFFSATTKLFELVDNEVLTVVTSEFTLAEVLVKPYETNNIGLQKAYLTTIQDSKTLIMAPVTKEILLSAAQLRAKFLKTLKLPDAIHLATALTSKCSLFVTNDRNLKKLEILPITIFSEITDTVLS
jgi:predicted nucleic acid-binding protein